MRVRGSGDLEGEVEGDDEGVWLRGHLLQHLVRCSGWVLGLGVRVRVRVRVRGRVRARV